MASCILVEIQKDPLTSFFSQGRIDKNKNEGDIVKGASYALLVADKLCRLCDLDGERFQEELDSFKLGLAPKSRNSVDDEDHVMRYGITRWCNMDNGDYANELLNQLNSATSEERQRSILTHARDELLANSGQIASFMGDLLDYKKEIKFDLEKAIPLSRAVLKKIPETTQRNEVRIEEMSEIFEADYHQIKYNADIDQAGKEQQIATIIRTDEESLIEVLSNHLQITQAAYPYFYHHLFEQQIPNQTSIGEEQSAQKAKSRYDEVKGLFLSVEVIEKNGWHETEQNSELNAEYLRKKVEGNINLGFKEGYKFSQVECIGRR